jgi:regulation of enolase protein 1 (concanavalin A-like superfamily)
MFRRLAGASGFVLTLFVTASAAADTTTITSGSPFYATGRPGGVAMSSSDSTFDVEPFASPRGCSAPRGALNASTSISVTNAGNHARRKTHHALGFNESVSGSRAITGQRLAPLRSTRAQETNQTVSFASSSAASGSSVPSPWETSDVGDVGQPGSASGSAGSFTVAGAGADIWGANDAFRFVYQFRPGDVEVVAQVTSEQNTNTFAKAGVMVRQSLDPASAVDLIDVRPNGVIEFMHRTNPGETMQWTSGAVAGIPIWLRLSRHGSFVTGYYSADGRSWTQIGAAVLTFSRAGLVGLAVTSHDRSLVNSSTFSSVSISPLPAPWTLIDVGAVGTPGGASESNGTFTVSGAGSDIWGAADSFSAVTQPADSTAQVRARVVSEQNTHVFAKAGLMLGGLDPSSARVVLDVKPDGEVEFMARLADGTSMSYLGGRATSFPVYLWLARNGNVVDAYTGVDGVGWTPIGRVQVTFPASVSGGLAVTSHNPAVLNTAAFDHVGVGVATGPGVNLMTNPGFEDSVVPATGPGWVSDSFRQTAAVSEMLEPRTGAKNGACRTTQSLDCGLYQDVTIPTSGFYTLTVHADASRSGAWVGWDVNGALVGSGSIATGGYLQQNFGHQFTAGDTVRVWLYSPNSPGWAVIDDVVLTLQ